MQKSLVATALAFIAIIGHNSVLAVTTVIRFNDYDGGGTSAPAYSFVAAGNAGVSTPVAGFAGIGVGTNVFSGNMFRNAEGLPSLGSGGTFSNLPAGGTLSFSFLFAAIDSWDGLSAGGPDTLSLTINGSTVFTTSFDNFPAPPASSTNGGTLLASGTNLGFSTFFDSAWDYTNVAGLQNIPYNGTTVNYRLLASGAGWSGGMDESWGLDNFRVSLTVAAVPEPDTYALLIAGIGVVGAIARRRNSSSTWRMDATRR